MAYTFTNAPTLPNLSDPATFNSRASALFTWMTGTFIDEMEAFSASAEFDKIGIGTSTPDGTLHVHTASAGTVTANTSADDLVVEHNASGGISILTPNTATGSIYFGDPDQPSQGRISYLHSSDLLALYASNSAVMTVGNTLGVRPFTDNTSLLGSVTNRWSAVHGATASFGSGVSPDGTLHVHTASAGTVAASTAADDLVVENSASGGISILTPNTATGSIFFGDPDDNDVGRIQYDHSAEQFVFYAGGASKLVLPSTGTLRPAVDNTQTLGSASYRWSEVFAGTGTINTSDERTKTDIQDLNAAEQAVAVAAKGLLKKYRFNDAKDAKGEAARWHFGIVAQELAAAFEAEGLDPWAYGLLCHDFWVEADVTIPAELKRVMVTPAELDEEGNEITPAVYEEVEETPERIERRTFATLADVPEGAANVTEHDRMGVRYDELFAFILAAI